MIGRFFQKKPVLKNGAGDEITLSSQADEEQHADWFLDTYRLSQALSKGDLSGPLAALKMIEEQTPVFLTAPGSVTQELWARMARFGYGTSENADDLPIPGHQKFTPHPHRLSVMVQFLMASRVAGNDVKALAPISKFLSQKRQSLMTLADDVLLTLRFGFNQTQKPISAPPKAKNPLFAELLKVGAFKDPTGEDWPISDVGLTTMPFLFDHILDCKGYDWPKEPT